MRPGMRLVATCWAADPDELTASVRQAADALEASDPAGSHHLIEARLDLLASPPSSRILEGLVREARGRLLVTCRPGGTGAPAGSERLALLGHALALGAVACDVEDAEPDPGARARGALLIRSHHAAAELFPDEASALARRLAAARADVVKIACPAGCAVTSLAWARAGAGALPASTALAALAVGSAGAWMRHLAGAPLLPGGRPLSALAYARAGEPLPGADLGQPLLADALGAWDMPSVSERTRRFGVVGWPLASTWSPRLHAALFRRRGLDARLVALPLRDMSELGRLAALGLAGVAVTMPHKAAASALASRRSLRVGRLGSANSLRRIEDGWEAEDFDGPAAAQALSRLLPLRGARVVVIGAGGAARAAGLALVESGASVGFQARDSEQAREAARITGAEAGEGLDAASVRDADILVNATPAGSEGHPSLADLLGEALPRAAVLDMVTFPSETRLVGAARAAGLRVADGLAMLALQAAAQQRWWSEGWTAQPALGDAETEDLLRGITTSQDCA